MAEINNELIDQHPDLRFGQILVNFGFLKTYTTGPQLDSTTHVTDPFSEEPMTTLSRTEGQIGRQRYEKARRSGRTSSCQFFRTFPEL
ncbi:hypothetical protein [Deinococcus altitudinis]|uniref:hypothetical protein n=1 Tax=Deinococcus altitudinis TaxID=468914 RepID=UPI0038913E51